MAKWGFLSNHAVVVIHLVDHPSSTLREIANVVGITERATHSIVRSLEEEEVITRRKQGRRNHYSVNVMALLTHQTRGLYTVHQLAEMLLQLADRLEHRASA